VREPPGLSKPLASRRNI
jgi:hypothetical protein